MDEKSPVLTPTEARQASPRRLNFRVLVTSLALAIVVAAVLYYVFYGFGVPPEGAQPAPLP